MKIGEISEEADEVVVRSFVQVMFVYEVRTKCLFEHKERNSALGEENNGDSAKSHRYRGSGDKRTISRGFICGLQLQAKAGSVTYGVADGDLYG